MSEHDDLSTTDAAHDGGAIAMAGTGEEQVWTFDSDGDGLTDAVQWEFADGTWQELRDVDGDGNADVLLIDVNGDNTADIQIWDNGDGTYTAAQDADGDGEYEVEQNFSRAELDKALPGITDLLDTQFGADTGVPGEVPADQPADESGQELDTDGDGAADTVQWAFADGTWQQLVDIDGDVDADVLLIDVNGDDQADVQIWDNGDGTYTAVQDADSDGVFETEATFTRDELDAAIPGVAELLDTRFGSTGTGVVQPVDNPEDEPGGDEPVALDTDSDGTADTLSWSFGDGTWQELRDLDGDSEADALVIDVNGDDLADYAIVENGDGTYTILQDADGDGQWDAEQTFTRAELDEGLPGVSDLLDSRVDGQAPGAGPDQPVEQPVDQPVDQPADQGDPTVQEYDADGDGVTDTVFFDYGDGTWQELRDLDADGTADELVVDTDGDGYANYGIAVNPDGTYTVSTNPDNDAEWNEQATLSRAELDAALPGVTDMLDARLDGFGSPVDTPTDAPVDTPTDAPVDTPTGAPVDTPTDAPVDTPTGAPVDTPTDAPVDVPSAEPLPVDSDGDGTLDTVSWSFGDGTWQELRDLDGDNDADALIVDTDGDGRGDYAILDNGNGTYTIYQDSNGDGEWNSEETFTRAELDAGLPGVGDLLDSRIDPNAAGSDDPVDSPVVAPPAGDDAVAGNPESDSQYWFQQAENGFCVPASVAMIVSEYTGEAILSEEQFVELATEMGLFTVAMDGTFGMTMADALTLLEAAGVPADLVVADMDTLYETLEDGRAVMLFVDSGEIWYGQEGQENASDHAVVITGIDREAGVAYLSDPGTPDGDMMAVPLSVLEDAWQDAGYVMVVCDEPAPDHPATSVQGGTDDRMRGLQAGTASLVDSPWALLPVVLPADAVVPAAVK